MINLTLDYMFVLAQQIDERVKNEFEKIVLNNPNCDELIKVINKEFNDSRHKDYYTEDS